MTNHPAALGANVAELPTVKVVVSIVPLAVDKVVVPEMLLVVMVLDTVVGSGYVTVKLAVAKIISSFVTVKSTAVSTIVNISILAVPLFFKHCPNLNPLG